MTSVTDEKLVTRDHFQSGNAHPLAKVIHGLRRTPQWENYYAAKLNASRCGECGAAIGKGQRVTWLSLKLATVFGSRWSEAPHCDKCADACSLTQHKYAGACEGCSRPVRLSMRRRFRIWCSESCAQRWYNAQRKQKPAPKACAVCSTTFTPTRSDATLCSDACKQKAYRQRKREAS